MACIAWLDKSGHVPMGAAHVGLIGLMCCSMVRLVQSTLVVHVLREVDGLGIGC